MTNTLYDALFAPLANRPGPLLILPDGATITGTAFLAMVAQTGHALRAAGVQPGDRVAAQVPKSPLALALYGATVAVGAIFLPLNTAYTPAEIDYFIGNATPRLFVCDPDRNAALTPVATAHGAAVLTLDGAGHGSLATALAVQPDRLTPAPRGPGDLAAILYTSGTTGRSKGAMLTHRNLLSNAEALAGLWQFTADDVLLHALPIFHTHGLFVASNTSLLTGGRMIFLPGFDLDAILRLLPQATAMMGVPTFYTRLLDDPRFTRDLTAGIRLFISGSAPLLAETHRAFRGPHRPPDTGALWHDGNQHEHLQPPRRGPARGHRGLCPAGGRAADNGRWRRGDAGRGGRDRSARAERLCGLLADAGEDRRRAAPGRLVHHRRSSGGWMPTAICRSWGGPRTW